MLDKLGKYLKVTVAAAATVTPFFSPSWDLVFLRPGLFSDMAMDQIEKTRPKYKTSQKNRGHDIDPGREIRRWQGDSKMMPSKSVNDTCMVCVCVYL